MTDAGKNGYSNLRTLMRTAYDLGSLFGIDFASDNSYSAIVDINICSMFCATPAAIDEYYDRKAIEGGNITRCIVCKMDDSLGEEGAIFTAYSAEQQAVIDSTLQKLMGMTYDGDGKLQPVVELDMSWLDKTVCKWVKEKAREATLSGSKALDVFRKRSSVSAFRVASLCYYLYMLDEQLTEDTIRRRVSQIYHYMAEYILAGMLARWGVQFENLNAKRELENKQEDKPMLFDQLTEVFTREQLKLQIEKQGLTTPYRVFLCKWKRLRVIEDIDKNTFKKIFRKEESI